jgi:hypothetical protein
MRLKCNHDGSIQPLLSIDDLLSIEKFRSECYIRATVRKVADRQAVGSLNLETYTFKLFTVKDLPPRVIDNNEDVFLSTT